MKQLTKVDNICSFEHQGIDITNPTISECGRFPVSPEYYGFTIWSTGGGCTAHGQEFVLDGQKVIMLITDGNLNHVTDDSEECVIGVYDSDMNPLDIYWEVKRDIGESIPQVMTDKQAEDLAHEAFTLAIAHIQDALGQTDGGFAGEYFSEEDIKPLMLSLLKDYAKAEYSHLKG